MNTTKILNSSKKKRKWKKKKALSGGWFTINIDLSDSIKVNLDLEKPKRVVNSGKKDDRNNC